MSGFCSLVIHFDCSLSIFSPSHFCTKSRGSIKNILRRGFHSFPGVFQLNDFNLMVLKCTEWSIEQTTDERLCDSFFLYFMVYKQELYNTSTYCASALKSNTNTCDTISHFSVFEFSLILLRFSILRELELDYSCVKGNTMSRCSIEAKQKE